MKKFVCSVCGYVHEGDSAPEFCPICKAPAEKFIEQSGDCLLYTSRLSAPALSSTSQEPPTPPSRSALYPNARSHPHTAVSYGPK